VVEALVSATPEMDWRRVHLTPGTESVLDACLDDSPQPPLPVIVTGFAEAAPHAEAMRRLMTGLNYSRPRWKPNLDVPVVMVVGPDAHRAMLEFAPDFARYRSATVRFLAAPAPTQIKGAFMPWLTPEQRRERMRELAAGLKEGSAYESEAGLYSQVERSWELSLHRLALGEPPGFEEAVRLACAMKNPRLPVEGRDSVEMLNLQGEQHVDATTLGELSALKILDLSRTNLNDEGLDALKELVGLQWLVLGDTAITDSGLISLRNLNHLTFLGLERTRITDLGLFYLMHLVELESLDLKNTQVTGEGFGYLRALDDLCALHLHGTQVNDDGLYHLRFLTHLQWLFLGETRITDAGLVHLRELAELRHLWLIGTQVTESGFAALREAMPRCEIYW